MTGTARDANKGTVLEQQPTVPPDVGLPVPAPGELPLLVVEAAGHRCGLPVDAVVQIHPAVSLSRLPDAPPVVVGLMNRRGTPVPVLSLRRRLGLADRQLQVDDHLVVLRLPERPVALLVDVAVDVRSVRVADVDDAAATDAAHSRGVAVLGDGLVVVVDLSSFLSAAEGAALDQSLAAASA